MCVDACKATSAPVACSSMHAKSSRRLCSPCNLPTHLLVPTVNHHTSRRTTAIHMQPKVSSIIILSVHICGAVQAGIVANTGSSSASCQGRAACMKQCLGMSECVVLQTTCLLCAPTACGQHVTTLAMRVQCQQDARYSYSNITAAAGISTALKHSNFARLVNIADKVRQVSRSCPDFNDLYMFNMPLCVIARLWNSCATADRRHGSVA